MEKLYEHEVLKVEMEHSLYEKILGRIYSVRMENTITTSNIILRPIQ